MDHNSEPPPSNPPLDVIYENNLEPIKTLLLRNDYYVDCYIGEHMYGCSIKISNIITHNTFMCDIYNLSVSERSKIRDTPINISNIIQNEVEKMKQMQHINGIIKFYTQITHSNFVLIVSEDCYDTSLSDYLHISPKNIANKDVIYIIKQIAIIVYEIHKVGLFHGHLKPSNIYLTKSHPKVRLKINTIEDQFSWFSTISEKRNTANTFIHDDSLKYIPPECHSDISSNSQSSDIWCIGMIIIDILESKNSIDLDGGFYDITEYERQEVDKIKDIKEIIPILSNCLKINKDKRITIKELLNYHIFRSEPDNYEDLASANICPNTNVLSSSQLPTTSDSPKIDKISMSSITLPNMNCIVDKLILGNAKYVSDLNDPIFYINHQNNILQREINKLSVDNSTLKVKLTKLKKENNKLTKNNTKLSKDNGKYMNIVRRLDQQVKLYLEKEINKSDCSKIMDTINRYDSSFGDNIHILHGSSDTSFSNYRNNFRDVVTSGDNTISSLSLSSAQFRDHGSLSNYTVPNNSNSYIIDHTFRRTKRKASKLKIISLDKSTRDNNEQQNEDDFSSLRVSNSPVNSQDIIQCAYQTKDIVFDSQLRSGIIISETGSPNSTTCDHLNTNNVNEVDNNENNRNQTKIFTRDCNSTVNRQNSAINHRKSPLQNGSVPHEMIKVNEKVNDCNHNIIDSIIDHINNKQLTKTLGLQKYLFSTGSYDLFHSNDNINSVISQSMTQVNDRNLTKLDLSNNNLFKIPRGFFQCYFDVLKLQNQLRVLDLTNCYLSTGGIHFLSSTFKYLTNLIELRLDNNEIDDKNVLLLVPYIKYLSDLEILSLSNKSISRTKISDRSLIPLISQLKSLNRLRNLYLTNNKFTIDSIRQFKYLTSIERLFIGGNDKIDDNGLIELSDNLKYLSRLYELWINKISITNTGLRHMLAVISNLSNIKNIDICDNSNITDINLVSEFSRYPAPSLHTYYHDSNQ